jgi:hypothetical protein
METKMYAVNLTFEQVPVEMAKRAAAQQWKSAGAGFVRCVVCAQPVELEHCKTDENGKAVHEKCYLKKTAAKVMKRRGRA